MDIRSRLGDTVWFPGTLHDQCVDQIWWA